MCLIVEHAHTLQKVATLEFELAALKIEHAQTLPIIIEPVFPTGFPIYDMEWGESVTVLSDANLVCMLKDGFKEDYKVYYTDEDSWRLIVPFLVSPADAYVNEGCDCGDYAKIATGRAALLAKLSGGCKEAWGMLDGEPHAFGLVFISRVKYKLFEPNAGFPWAGELFNDGEHGYKVKYWK